MSYFGNVRKITVIFAAMLLIATFIGCVDNAIREDKRLQYGVLEGTVYVPLPEGASPVESEHIPAGYMPLSGALVEVLGMRTYTDEQGNYRFSAVPVGTQTVKIYKDDHIYETLAVVQ